VPSASVMPAREERGEMRTGVPVMYVAAPVVDDDKPLAVLGLRLRPEGPFSELMAIGRPGHSGETYAFSRAGLFLTQSRFDEEMKEIGLLPDLPGARSVLTGEMRDPGMNLYEGGRR